MANSKQNFKKGYQEGIKRGHTFIEAFVKEEIKKTQGHPLESLVNHNFKSFLVTIVEGGDESTISSFAELYYDSTLKFLMQTKRDHNEVTGLSLGINTVGFILARLFVTLLPSVKDDSISEDVYNSLSEKYVKLLDIMGQATQIKYPLEKEVDDFLKNLVTGDLNLAAQATK